MMTAIHGFCEEADRAIYYNKHSARKELRRHLKKASVRLYRCKYHPGHLHLTRQWKKV